MNTVHATEIRTGRATKSLLLFVVPPVYTNKMDVGLSPYPGRGSRWRLVRPTRRAVLSPPRRRFVIVVLYQQLQNTSLVRRQPILRLLLRRYVCEASPPPGARFPAAWEIYPHAFVDGFHRSRGRRVLQQIPIGAIRAIGQIEGYFSRKRRMPSMPSMPGPPWPRAARLPGPGARRCFSLRFSSAAHTKLRGPLPNPVCRRLRH